MLRRERVRECARGGYTAVTKTEWIRMQIHALPVKNSRTADPRMCQRVAKGFIYIMHGTNKGIAKS